MKGKVGIAELGAHLNDYVRAAQEGEEIVIQDGDTPVAKLVPLAEQAWPRRIIPATLPSRGIDDFEGFCPEGLTQEDVDRALAETRADSIDDWLDEWLSSHASTSKPR